MPTTTMPTPDRSHGGSAVRRRVWRVGREIVRTSGVVTARLRPVPDFLIIGAKRGGTTSMYRYLLGHPRVLPMFPSARRLPLAADPKGAHYFDTGYGHGPAWYRSHFPTRPARAWASRRAGGPVLAGEASPYYLFHPQAPGRAATTVPAAHLVLLLRDPVQRTFSHYREQVRNGKESLDFEAALAAEPSRLAAARRAGPGWADSVAYEHQGYVAQSEYAGAVARWLAVFPPEQLLVLRSEDFYDDPQTAYNAVLSFLGLPRWRLPAAEPWNAAPTAEMSGATRQRLRAHFEPHDAELAALLGRDFGWGT